MSSTLKPSRIEAESATSTQLEDDPGQVRGTRRHTRPQRTSEEILADLEERLPWLRPGSLGAPRRVSLAAYTVNCGRCQRPCTHGPYFRLVLGRHTRGRSNGSTCLGKRSTPSPPPCVVASGSQPETSARSPCSGGTTGKFGSTTVAMGPGEGLVAHVAAGQDAGGGSRRARAGVKTRSVSSSRNRQRAEDRRVARRIGDHEASAVNHRDMDMRFWLEQAEAQQRRRR